MAQQTPPGPPSGPPQGQPAGGPPPTARTDQPTDAQGRVLAEWWKRAVAALIDGVILSIPVFLLLSLFGLGIQKSAETSDAQTVDGGAIAGFFITWLVYMVVAIAYYVYFHGNERGQTPGKMVMNLQLRDEASGGPVGYGKAALRWLTAGALGLLCGVGSLIDVLFPLWDPKRQTIHDKAANTLVIDLKP